MLHPSTPPAFRPVSFRPPTLRPHGPVLAYAPPYEMGSPSMMTAGDWLLLVGGVVVTGVGVNGIIGQAVDGRFNAVGLLLDLVFLGLGGTVFVQKFGKMTS